MDITELLVFAKKNKSSDLHLSTGNPPVLRVHGEMMPMKMEPLEASQVKELLYSVMSEMQRSDYERNLELDFALSLGNDMRFRINAFNTNNGPAAVFRSIPTEILSLDQLKAPAILKELSMRSKGLILVTGPTGSGKSTTLAAMVDYINQNTAKHILTIEDPIEFVHRSKRSLINQREIGSSTKTFPSALKSALREDPDVILVGEMRDLETIQLAMTAAETGHLVLGTLHTNSAPKTVDRIIDVFPANDKEMIRAMLSVSLEAAITQTLMRRADGTGRVAAHEILMATPPIRNLIRENKIPQIASMMQTGSKVGMCTMKDAVQNLLDSGQITTDEARKVLMGKPDTGEGGANAAQQNSIPAQGSSTGF
jgi:twitching motility protein PilT